MDVKALRRQLGLSTDELAERLPTSRRTIERWENQGMRPNQMARARLRQLAQEYRQRQAQGDGPTKRQLDAAHLEMNDAETDNA